MKLITKIKEWFYSRNNKVKRLKALDEELKLNNENYYEYVENYKQDI